MKNIKICTLLVSVVIILLLVSCKKEKQQNEIFHLKSVTQTSSDGVVSKTEFEYNTDGMLIQTRWFVNEQLQNYVNFIVNNGQFRNATVFSTSLQGEDQALSKIIFEYQNGRLNALTIREASAIEGDKSGSSYLFDYTKINAPKVSIKYEDSYKSVGGQTSIPIDPVTGKELSVSGNQWDLTADKKFDNKRNPYVGLPVFVFFQVNLPHSAPQAIYTGISFDPSLFLLPNNVLEEPSLIAGRKVSISYTYNQRGLPVKSVRESGISNTRLETIYEYY